MTENGSRHASSFRDPSGFVTVRDGNVFRTITPKYFKQYQSLTDSGFYQKLFDNKLLIPHQEIRKDDSSIEIQPEKIGFITYPYEWSFSQYKHAALHTLKLQRYCLQHGYTLKDATAFNIAFHNGAPIFIDTLSFDFYEEGQPWRAYRQFLMHFLAPLVLAKYHGSDMLRLMVQYIDGVPLDKTVSLLPFSARFNAVLYSNLYLAAKYDKKYSNSENSSRKINVGKSALLKIIESLYEYIRTLELSEKTEWKDYYQVTNYDDNSFELKKQLVREWTQKIGGKRILDMGGNDGTFSRVLQDTASEIVVMDIDPNAVDQNYLQVIRNKERILPVVCDLLNPSPGIGFGNSERTALLDRIRDFGFDATLALALIHHLTLTGNVPFEMSAPLFASFSPYLIIEFPDRDDSWVKFLLDSKREFKDHFDFYNKTQFETDYGKYFDFVETQKIAGTERTLYLLKRK